MRACDYSIFCIEYETTFAERVQSCGGMDSELTGKQITERRKYYVVAPTLDLAEAEFKRYHSHNQKITTSLMHQLNGFVVIC